MVLRILALWLFLCYSYSKADVCLPNHEGLCEPGVTITEDVQIEVSEEDLGTEIDMILQEITIISDVARDMRSDMKADLRQMNGDIRHITEIVNDVEDRQKEDARELLDEMKLLEENLDLKINKALNNPLNSMSAKSK